MKNQNFSKFVLFRNQKPNYTFGTRIMRIWKASFDFQFKIEMKIEKIVTFDFCRNIEFWI